MHGRGVCDNRGVVLVELFCGGGLHDEIDFTAGDSYIFFEGVESFFDQVFFCIAFALFTQFVRGVGLLVVARPFVEGCNFANK